MFTSKHQKFILYPGCRWHKHSQIISLSRFIMFVDINKLKFIKTKPKIKLTDWQFQVSWMIPIFRMMLINPSSFRLDRIFGFVLMDFHFIYLQIMVIWPQVKPKYLLFEPHARLNGRWYAVIAFICPWLLVFLKGSMMGEHLLKLQQKTMSMNILLYLFQCYYIWNVNIEIAVNITKTVPT